MDRTERSLLRGVLRRGWPWALQVVVLLLAAAAALHFPSDADREFPGVARPFFSDFPPATYRLAEPGDTLDRVALYVAAIGAGLSLLGWARSRGSDARQARLLWGAGLVVCLLSGWDAATPSPTFDGWPGIGPEVIGNREASATSRVLAALVLGVGLLTLAWAILKGLPRLGSNAGIQRLRRVGPLAVLAGMLWLAARFLLPGFEPAGYWSKWALIGSLLAFASILVRCLPESKPGRKRVLDLVGLAAVSGALVAVGLGSFWLHRPIDRFREVVPGKIFLSAMPTPDGLPIVHARHQFKTIINLFQEDLPGLRHPLLDQEMKFARENGINYIGSPLGASSSDDFLNQTLRLAQDPDAWPILLHCHACMDRTPAWWGIYQFVVEGKPLDQVMRSIEQHRGTRPKASVTLIYNRVLEPRAPERYRDDPTARLLRRAAEGTVDPYYEQLAKERAEARTLGRRDDSNASIPR
jgi:hypothetical protein